MNFPGKVPIELLSESHASLWRHSKTLACVCIFPIQFSSRIDPSARSLAQNNSPPLRWQHCARAHFQPFTTCSRWRTMSELFRREQYKKKNGSFHRSTGEIQLIHAADHCEFPTRPLVFLQSDNLNCKKSKKRVCLVYWEN